MNKELKYWLAFSKLDGVGSASLLDIFNHFKSMKAAWIASTLDWQNVKQLRNSTITTFKEKQKEINLEKLEEKFLKKNINVVTIEDDAYPECLRNIDNPPAILYFKGDFLNKDFNKTLAIVGSRRCSSSAVENTKFIVKDLKSAHAIIVSGGAYGIDTAAHTGAVEGGLETIVVLGGGLEHLYPKQNIPLFNKVLENNGVLLSEYYPETPPDVFRFPERNRIISGLSKGTLVAEANIKSGALITARLCLEQGKELMCMPGLLSNPNTQGTHKLLKEGASLVTSSEDIINYLGWEVDKPSSCDTNINSDDLTEDERNIVELIAYEPVNVEKIALKTNININDLMIMLTMLELKGIIKQLPGEVYMKA
ncbi:MAG: DNA-processing protein DprA [Candidatus Gastranaerophilales bacterium]|nr:DNA-processing protein DprA [Candidatus Gastranaerophilales bacterium]